MQSITPAELKRRLDRGDALVLLDVREPGEAAIARLAGSTLIPLRELRARIGELDPDAETVVYCHHGIRSAHAIAHLEPLGLRRLLNLSGGIDRWAREVDRAMAR
jgi:rhodanese-related sulfurtransferase